MYVLSVTPHVLHEMALMKQVKAAENKRYFNVTVTIKCELTLMNSVTLN